MADHRKLPDPSSDSILSDLIAYEEARSRQTELKRRHQRTKGAVDVLDELLDELQHRRLSTMSQSCLRRKTACAQRTRTSRV